MDFISKIEKMMDSAKNGDLNILACCGDRVAETAYRAGYANAIFEIYQFILDSQERVTE